MYLLSNSYIFFTNSQIYFYSLIILNIPPIPVYIVTIRYIHLRYLESQSAPISTFFAGLVCACSSCDRKADTLRASLAGLGKLKISLENFIIKQPWGLPGHQFSSLRLSGVQLALSCRFSYQKARIRGKLIDKYRQVNHS